MRPKYSFKKVKDYFRKTSSEHTASDKQIEEFVATLNYFSKMFPDDVDWDKFIDDSFKKAEKFKKEERIKRES